MPVTIITQADSPVGGARAQAHLKLILDSTLSKIHMCHEMMITSVSGIFDQKMNIPDAKVMSRLNRHANDFINFTQKNMG
jgi:chromate reductase